MLNEEFKKIKCKQHLNDVSEIRSFFTVKSGDKM